MPIGKDSIQKRVAKVATPEAEVKEATLAKKPAVKSAAKPATKAPAKKPTVKKAPAKAEPAPAEPATTVMANVSPETVAAVIGHDEKKPAVRIQIGGKLPTHLL